MFRSQLKNKIIKSRNSEDWSNYNKQRNFCTNLLKKVNKTTLATRCETFE